jgi:3-oxoacyl-[acyl-carrier protein] reductase
MDVDLSGKRAIVTGGSRGIGRAIGLALAEAGAHVSICARGAEALEAARAEIAANGVTAHAATCDLADGNAVARYVSQAAEALGGIDILVNNASGFGSTDDEAGWEKSLTVDLLATVRATRAATPFLEKSDGAAILNISSTSAFHPSVRTTPYGVAKAAIIQYTRNRAAALAPQHIRVNCIAPGSIEFPGGSWERRKASDPQLYNAILRSIPFGRLGEPEEVARVALFLVSPLAAWVTGQTIMVDGGQTLGR